MNSNQYRYGKTERKLSFDLTKTFANKQVKANKNLHQPKYFEIKSN